MDDRLRVTIGNDLWFAIREGDGPVIYMQAEWAETGEGEIRRLVPRRVLVEGDPEVTSDLLRSVKPARLVAKLIGPKGAFPRKRLPEPAETWGPPVAPPTEEDVVDHGDWRGSELRRPTTGEQQHPSAFYEDVAREYLHAIRVSSKPAVLMAEAAGVPVSTAHRWVREARRRGFLPAGQKGRAG